MSRCGADGAGQFTLEPRHEFRRGLETDGIDPAVARGGFEQGGRALFPQHALGHDVRVSAGSNGLTVRITFEDLDELLSVAGSIKRG